MAKLKVLVVEDKPDDRNVLLILLERYFKNDLEIYTAKSFDEAVALLVQYSFHISLLDVQLGDHQSYELLDAWEPDKFGSMVFMTVEESIPRSVISKLGPQNCSVIDKPFYEAQVARVIGEITEKYMGVVITIPETNGNYRFVKIATIYYVTVMDGKPKHSVVHFFDKNTLISIDTTWSLAYFEREHGSHLFTRCSKSMIVNVHHLESYSKSDETLNFYNQTIQSINYSPHYLENIISKKQLIERFYSIFLPFIPFLSISFLLPS